METKLGFTKMTIQEFELWISQIRIARTILRIQQHHTYIPSYIHFKGQNHFELQKGMKNFHVLNNGWNDIGQHFTTFPDGTIMTGRSLEKSPACITGNNAHSICIENIGNFDLGGDIITDQQSGTIIRMTAALCKKFNRDASAANIIYHHWFNLSTGERNNGSRNNKSCPGTNFFGGNKVRDFEANFLPMVQLVGGLTNTPVTVPVIKYALVTADTLNIRSGPKATHTLVRDREPLSYGVVVRVYEIVNGWFKISSSATHWINGRYTQQAKRMIIKVSTLNIRSGPSTKYPKIGNVKKGVEVFITEEVDGWARISTDNRWVSSEYLE